MARGLVKLGRVGSELIPDKLGMFERAGLRLAADRLGIRLVAVVAGAGAAGVLISRVAGTLGRGEACPRTGLFGTSVGIDGTFVFRTGIELTIVVLELGAGRVVTFVAALRPRAGREPVEGALEPAVAAVARAACH